MEGGDENQGVVGLAQQTLQANREHLDALKTYSQRLGAELETLDQLLETVDTIDESDLDIGCTVTIPGSVRAIAPIVTKDLLSPESLFYTDALKRSHYQSFSEVHPMKPKELEVLAQAVQAEGRRQHALDIQKRGFTAFQNLDAEKTYIPALDTEGIDWNRIAENVSAVSMTNRTAKECKIRWLGDQHPEFNHEVWSKEEVLKVKSLTAEFAESRPDWAAVAKRLGTRRTPLDCMRHATSRKLHQWTAESDERLLEAVHMYGHNNWHLVARYVSEDATASQCSSRFEKTLDESIKHTAWSPEEDLRLSAAVAAYGSSWVDVAANIPGRHNDQCRDRWNEQVNPSINKCQWSEEEDKILLGYVREHRNASWKDVSERLSNGRTEAMCRNRYAILQKDVHTFSALPSVDCEGETHVTSIDQAPASADFTPPDSNTFIFKSAFPAAPDIENHQLNRIVFLEPVVSSNTQSQERHGPQPPARFKMVAVGDTQPSSSTAVPPSKRRRTRSRIVKPKKPAMETQLRKPIG